MLFFENSPTIFDKDNDLVNYSETVVKHSQQIYPKTYCLSNNEGLNVWRKVEYKETRVEA